MILQLSTTCTTLDDLWRRHHAVRKGTKSVSVPVDALYAILEDHSKLVRRLEDCGDTVHASAD